MDESPSRCRLTCVPLLAVLFLLAGTGSAAPPVRTLTLQQLNQRDPDAGFAPLHLGEQVQIQGVVNSAIHSFRNYQIVSIQDSDWGAFLLLPAGDSRLASTLPGDEIRVTGEVALQDGVGMVKPSEIERVGHRAPPVPVSVSLRELSGFRNLGRLVRTSGRITATGETPNGSYVKLELPAPITVFLPRSSLNPPLITGLDIHSQVMVTGVGFQYCTSTPYDRYFQILVHNPSEVAASVSDFRLTAALIVAVAALVLLGIFLFWNRERRSASQRERLRKSYQLGEELLSASSTGMILERLSESLPAILGVSGVQLYVHNRSAKSLDAVPHPNQEIVAISLSAPPGGPRSGAVACFHYRTLLVIPDLDRSPFPAGKGAGPLPKSLLFAPMMAQGEVIGVLELDQNDRVRDFDAAEQELAQHFANQVAVAVRLLDQRLVQEQLFRTEKMAAVGRLISGVVNELQTPLASISDLAGRVLEWSRSSPAERDLLTLAAEARKASGIVARLVSFAAAEQSEARQVGIGTLLHNLIEFREGDWKASGIRVKDLTRSEQVTVLGSHGQLEQVFLNLLVHAEQALAEASQKVISIRTSVLAKRVIVEISFTAPPGWRKAEETAAVLGVTRSVIGGHGGEVRLIEKGNAEPRFEVELPVAGRERQVGAASRNAAAGDPGRKNTALLIEPDEAAQRQLVALLTARGYRAVPIENADNGLELAHRLRFDLAFCSVHAPGLNWVELSERMHSRVGGFVLVSDAYNSELAADFEGDHRFVLSKPFQEADLDRILGNIEPTLQAIRHGAA